MVGAEVLMEIVVVGVAVEVVWADLFCLFGVRLFGEDMGVKVVRDGGRGDGVCVVEVVSGVRMSLGGVGAGNTVDVVSSGGDLGVAGGGAW